MNVDIFACMNFHEFEKLGNFMRIPILVSKTFGLCKLYQKLFLHTFYQKTNYPEICVAQKYLCSQ